jgi:shikimate dehydrogenase
VIPTPRTRVFALLGDPVAHSRSPAFQNAALRAAALDGVYVALRCDPADVAGLLRGLALAGGGGNVTVPHKERAFAAVERRTEVAEATGAVNTYWGEGGEVWGDNTDVAGMRAAVAALLGGPAAGARVLLLGAGGSARAVVHALGLDGADEVCVRNRSPERAAALASRTAVGPRLRVLAPGDDLGGERFDLAVNATSLGLKPGDALPLDPASPGAPAVGAALDLVYAPGGETPWVRAMRARGVPAADGTEMLLRQGAAAFARWWGREPDTDVMRAALAGAG